MKHILSFLKPYKLPITIAYSLTFVELAVELLLPLFLGKMINDGVVAQDMNNILMWGSIMIGLAFLAFTSGIVNSFYASHTSTGFAYDVRRTLFTKIQSFSFANLNKYPTSSLVTRFTNDVRQIQNTIFMGLRIMTRAPLMVLGGVIMAFIVNAKLALIFLVTVPLLIRFLFWVLRKASHMFERVQQKVDEVNSIMQENFMGMRLIKAFLRRNFEEKRFTKANENLANVTRSAFRFVEASMPVLLFVMNLSLIFIIWVGNVQVVAGDTSVGDVVAVVNYALRIAMSISMFTFITMAFSRAKASAHRLSDVLSVEEDFSAYSHTEKQLSITRGKVDFQNVSFTYPGAQQPVLKDLTFSIHPREKLAVMGATGSGKTTLFQLILRFYDHQAGTITIDDEPITHYSLDELRGSIGFVSQSPLLFSGSVRDNIMWGKEDATEDEVIQAAKDAQIHHLIMELPDAYETEISQRGVNLSGGQKQRISIARALVRQPNILMLDDSTSALDVVTEKRLLDMLEHDEATTLLITQKVSTAMRADRILLMDDGAVLALGTHDELLKKSTLYQAIVESQFGKEPPHVYKST